MSAQALDDDDVSPDQLPRKKFSGKKLVLFVLLPLLLLIGGGAAVYFSGVLDMFGAKKEEAHHEEKPAEEPVIDGPGVFYTVPDLLVNLNSGNQRRQNFLKISIAIELASQQDVAAIERVMPRIIDNFQVYLRELRLDDLRGSAGMYRLREELLLRISQAAQPVRIRDVLFREMLVQ
ncbi:flagellar basal body-associated FliL family protein [Arenibaculum pallidiluteum]|uniref:flagellar basal body-associated FliL family protein n=1 Tax=Arenibaculum pallidiluteum TaxID=2812559 RepID=UPI001A966656|nr:flagellar basal body-associated FliL family protein [Arenibaculum pallidiluteum]